MEIKECYDETYQKIAESIHICPRCGGQLKYNYFWAFRCRECDTEYTIYVNYDKNTDKSFFKGKEDNE